MIQLRRQHVYFCFDIFLPKCDERVRADVDSSNTQPIHEIRKSGRVYTMPRNRRLDPIGASQYVEVQKHDKGDRPYFDDLFSALVYEDGMLVEGFQYGDGEPLNQTVI